MKESLFSRIPIAWRITGWYSIFLFLMLILLATFTMQFIKIFEDTEMRGDLEHHMIQISEGSKRYTPLHKGIYTVLYTNSNYIARGALPDGFPEHAPISINKITKYKNDNLHYYYYDVAYRTPIFNGYARGVIPIDTFHRKTNSIFLAFLAGGIAFIILTTLGGYLLIRRGLKPIRLMTKRADEIGQSTDLSKRLDPVPGSDEIHKLGETLNSMLNSLEKSSEREKQFSAAVSHELRTPISVIQAESDYGRNYIASLDEAKESFTHIFKQSKMLSSMISQLLEIARIDNLKNVQKEKINMSTLMNELISEYKLLAEAKHVKLEAHIRQNMYVEANPILLQRAIGNIIDNALKFCSSEILIDCALNHAGRIQIDISDDGQGISKEDLSKIWDRLYQASESRNKNKNDGIGLGLYFVKTVIKLHNGTIHCASTLGKQTTFTVIL